MSYHTEYPSEKKREKMINQKVSYNDHYRDVIMSKKKSQNLNMCNIFHILYTFPGPDEPTNICKEYIKKQKKTVHKLV